MNFKRIVVTTDFSDNAATALPLAVELARKFGADIEVVHVVEDLSSYVLAEGIAYDISAWTDAIYKERKGKLKLLTDRICKKNDIKTTGVLLEGDAARAVAKHLRADSDCVVIATHGRTGIAHLLLGSTAEKIVRLAPCPVLTVPLKKMKA